jgi:hypothetical protein
MTRRFPLFLLVTLLMSLIAGLVSAGEVHSVFSHPVDRTHQALANSLAGYSRYAVVRGAFTQVKTVERFSRSFESRGVFIFSGSNGIIWEVR